MCCSFSNINLENIRGSGGIQGRNLILNTNKAWMEQFLEFSQKTRTIIQRTGPRVGDVGRWGGWNGRGSTRFEISVRDMVDFECPNKFSSLFNLIFLSIFLSTYCQLCTCQFENKMPKGKRVSFFYWLTVAANKRFFLFFIFKSVTISSRNSAPIHLTVWHTPKYFFSLINTLAHTNNLYQLKSPFCC